MNGRVPCINPSCNRTAATDKHPGCDEIICGKCFKALPDRLRKRYRQLRKRDRKLCSYFNSKRSEHVSDKRCWRLNRNMNVLIEKNWAMIRNYYQAPAEKPQGLEAFLQEIGLDD